MPTPKVVWRRRLLRWIGAVLLLMLLGAIGERWYLDHFAPLPPEETAGVSSEERAVLELVNHERSAAGLAPLKLGPKVTVSARSHSYDMALRHYMSHVSPDGVAPAARLHGVGINYSLMGENVYKENFPDHSALPTRVVKGWMSSPPHRANILSPEFRETGIGIAYAANGESYVTEDFIR